MTIKDHYEWRRLTDEGLLLPVDLPHPDSWRIPSGPRKFDDLGDALSALGDAQGKGLEQGSYVLVQVHTVGSPWDEEDTP